MASNGPRTTPLSPSEMHEFGVVPKGRYEEARRTARAAIRIAIQLGGSHAEKLILDEIDKLEQEENRGR